MALLPQFIPWTPASNTSGMVCWWDAADTSTTTIASGRLTEWRDKSPLGAPAYLTPFTASNGPQPTTINGLQAFSFFNNGLRTVADYFNFNDFTVCAAFVPPATASAYERLLDHDSANGWWIGRDNTAAAWTGGILETASPWGISVPLTNGLLHQIGMRRAGTVQNILGNGGGLLTRTVPATQTSSRLVAVAANFTGTQTMSNYGVVAEVLIWARAVFDSEMRRTEGFLAHKWGSADRLPVDHPYKDRAPGSYIATGTAGAVTLAGQPVAFRSARRTTAQSGARTLSGKNAVLTYAKTDDPLLSALTGELALTGNSINLTYSRVNYRMRALPGVIELSRLSAYGQRSDVQPGILRFGRRVDLRRW